MPDLFRYPFLCTILSQFWFVVSTDCTGLKDQLCDKLNLAKKFFISQFFVLICYR